VFDWLFRALQRVFVDGPDPVAPDDPRGWLEVLLPWPVRLLAVGSLALATSFWQDSGIGQQISWGLQVGALCLVSIIADFWWLFLLLDCALAAAWLVPFEAREDAPRRWLFLHVVTFLNRQVEHFKALLIWMLVAFAASSSLTWQVVVMSAAFLLAPPAINGLARLKVAFLGSEPATKASGGLFWRRRILIYTATLLGLLGLVFAAPKQLPQVVPLLAAFAGGLGLRVTRHLLRASRVRQEQAENADTKLDARSAFRQQQAVAAASADWCGPSLAIVAMALVIVLSWYERGKLAQNLSQSSDGASSTVAACQRDAGGPVSPDIALFVMADTQTHELTGKPFPGQTELAQALVKTAVRPVALDMLSSVAVKQFLAVYQDLARERQTQQLSPPFWAHLGDLADIGCKHELERMLTLLEPFEKIGPLASIAVGNHESAFEGSFHWSPYWDSACSSGRLRPDDAATQLEKAFFAKSLPANGEFNHATAPYFNPSGASLTSVVPLGITKHGQQTRGVIGVFLDTSDGRAFDWGSPGSIGAVSADQINSVEGTVKEVRAKASDAYAKDPAYVIFAHVPLDALETDSKRRVERLIADLDAKASADAEPRVLALITAHTHVASSHQHCEDGSNLREIVLGSTVDPPEQAAVVELGPDQLGRLSLRVRTLGTVVRPAQSCEPEPSLPSVNTCRGVTAALLRVPACRALLVSNPHIPARECQDLEQNATLNSRLSAVVSYQGPRNEDDKRKLQAVDAKALLDCICHDDRTCKPANAPLADESYLEILNRKFEDASHRPELVCLAWAASATQAHKDAGMTMSEAMRCSFDDPTLPAERVSVVTLEATRCY
jgi:hypothetical protein